MKLIIPLLMFVATPALQAGVHLSTQPVNDLPASWRGFLPDHRGLRLAAAPQLRPGAASPPLRDTFADAALKLEAAGRVRPLTADETADLAGLYIRIGQPDKAVALLRTAARTHPDHFRTVANLGTAWQLVGDIEQAALALEEAVRLAPEPLKEAETYHLKLVRSRLKEGRAARDASTVDDLFGVRYVGESGKPEAGTIAAAEMKKLPENAAAIVQRLALWLPADGRLLWQLGETANATGDVRTAANILDGCVTELGMKSTDLRSRRQLYRSAADTLAREPGHDRHRGTLKFQSDRPFASTFDSSRLPPVRHTGTNPLPWPALTATTLGPGFRPTFVDRVTALDGKRVAVAGYMTPAAGDDAELTGFLLTEYPVGCWFCETPSPLQMVSVDLMAGTSTQLSRDVVKVVGTLRVNRDDPERFLFAITGAAVGPAD